MAWEDVCPKGLPLLEVYAFLRRKMLGAGLASGRNSNLVQIEGVGSSARAQTDQAA